MRKVLSIDGGGIRGIIPSLGLNYLERESGRPISELFDLCVGTSAGGIIALGLAQADAIGAPKYSAHDLADFFENSAKVCKSPQIQLKNYVDLEKRCKMRILSLS